MLVELPSEKKMKTECSNYSNKNKLKMPKENKLKSKDKNIKNNKNWNNK